MNRILSTYATPAAAAVGIALVLLGNAGAQEEQQEQQSQSAEQKSEQQQAEEQQQSAQQEQQQAAQEQQRAEQQRQEEQQRQQQQEQERSRDQQQRDREQSSDSRWSEPRESRWPQPDGRDYGSDSLDFRGDRSQSGERQGGLGVGLIRDDGIGVLIVRVNPGSPAEEMGIREGDRITQVNGREVRSVQEFISRIRGMEPGQQVELDIRRASGGERRTVSGELESREEALAGRGEERGLLFRRGLRDSGDQDRNRQTRYEEDSRTMTSQRGGRMRADRLDQLERQVDRMSREIQQLRFALQDARREAGSSRSSERTAGYDEYQRSDESQQAREGRGDREYRQAERTRESGGSQDSDRYQSSQSRDRSDESPGGEVGEDRLHVGSEDIDQD